MEPPPVLQVVPGPVSSQPDASKPQPEQQGEPDYKFWGDTWPQWIMAGAALAALALAGITLELLRRTLNATKEAASYAKRAAEATEATIHEAKTSALATVKAAEAADLSARAAVGVEAPWLVLYNMHVSGTDNPRNWNTPRPLQVVFTNRGRTDGIVIRNSLAWSVSEDLPDEPRYPLHSLQSVATTMIVEPTKYFQFHRDFSVMDGDMNEIYAGQKRLWIWGYVVVRDFLGSDNMVGFCRVLELVPHQMYQGQEYSKGRFAYGGPASYTYSKRIS